MNNTVAIPAVFPWPKAALVTLLALLSLLALYWPTFYSMVEIWERSETFTHGFMIFPISAWLIWGRRHHLARIEPRPDWRGLAWMGLASLGWLVAEAGGVRVVSQYALIAMLIGAIWTILGWQVVKALTFPLLFLCFAVPVGEFLIPPLMNFTADFTVAALQLTGIPVYREGTYFSIPSGDWSVIHECSGIRYLLASLTLGTLYAYLTYRSWKPRLVFSILSLIVPIIANGFRAYMIVMIAHLSDMKLALGVDHYLYGWVFFGIVMLLLFWLGSFWREDEVEPANLTPEQTRLALSHDTLKRYLPAIASVLALSMLAPVYATWVNQRALPEMAELKIQPVNGWQQGVSFTSWEPHWQGADRRFKGNFSREDRDVYLEVAYYATQRQDAELINSQNFFIELEHPVWSNVGETSRTAIAGERQLGVRQAKLRSNQQRLLAWQWNVVDGRVIGNDYEAKLRLALSKVFGGRDDGTAIIIATPYGDSLDAAEKTLSEFAADMIPAVERAQGQ
jgi:exosortase A